ncbi:MAG: glycosyltransferase family 9 protein [Nanoarchaeota archaeon]|nr:glycosyltransferase family 9 protein [Nanoarchaeota archaeon]MBU1005140.1 glycosyltransferase family 9 protein [Nanoarchaeota archaeon]MBU1946011.1 glycosyltransferase family 9 protein [Nanoarchaeota archaeon]
MGIKLIKFIDKVLGTPLCIILSLFNIIKKQAPLKEKTKKILIIQLWGIGETILTIPAIKELSKRYRLNIDILCTKRNIDVYSGYSFLGKLHVIKLSPFYILLFMLKKFRSYDIVIDMEEYLKISSIISFFVGKYMIGYAHSIRSLLYSKKVKYNDKQHTSMAFFDLIRPLGIDGTVKKLERLNYSSMEKKIVDLELNRSGINRRDLIIGIAAGAAESSRSRIWPKERFAELIQELYNKNPKTKFILVGADYEKELNDSIIRLVNNVKIAKSIFNFAGKFTLRQSFYLISTCNIFIGNDSGPMHIAAAMDVKTIGLFGPNLPLRFAPLNSKSASIYKRMLCSPCINVHKGKVPECIYKGNDFQKCMKEIKIKDILNLM